MKLFVTGGAGFIGSNFIHYWVEHNPQDEIVVVDNLSPYGNKANIQALEDSGRIRFYCADICDFHEMKRIYETEKIDVVVNFAAESHNDRAIIDPTSFVRSNVLGAQTLLEASRLVGVKRHVHVSTIEVYGEQDEQTPFFTEASPLNAKTPYSAAKAAGDMIVRAYMQTYKDMDICMTHCANNYGPYQFPEKLIPLVLTNIMCGKKAPLYGDGLQMRDWLHVIDHCRAIELIIKHPKKFEFSYEAATRPELLPIFDISARHAVTNKQIVETIIRELGKDPGEWIEYVGDRPNHDRKYLIDPKKIETDLGFKPTVNFEEGLRATVRWYMENEAWWREVLARRDNLQVDWSRANIPGFKNISK